MFHMWMKWFVVEKWDVLCTHSVTNQSNEPFLRSEKKLDRAV